MKNSWNNPRIVLAAIFLGASLVALIVLRQLPYSSGDLTAASATDARRQPGPDFRLGPLEWRVADLSRAPELALFREALQENCAGRTGLDAATCGSVALARRFPNGEPSSEFVNSRFDPVDHLRRHLGGEPGHCLTRSAILAAQLLSVGIPARVVQLIPPDGKGHTLVEVWDKCCGWLLVDPTYGGTVGSPARLQSAADLQAAPDGVTWYGIPSKDFPSEGGPEQQRFMREAFKGHLLYPEPWLYLRLGHKAAAWPFRGSFARVGPDAFLLGPAQKILLLLAPTLAVLGLALLASASGSIRALRVAVASREGTIAKRAAERFSRSADAPHS